MAAEQAPAPRSSLWEDGGSCSDGDVMLRPREGRHSPGATQQALRQRLTLLALRQLGWESHGPPVLPWSLGPGVGGCIIITGTSVFDLSSTTLNSFIFSIASPNSLGGRDDPISQTGRLRCTGWEGFTEGLSNPWVQTRPRRGHNSVIFSAPAPPFSLLLLPESCGEKGGLGVSV